VQLYDVLHDSIITVLRISSLLVAAHVQSARLRGKIICRLAKRLVLIELEDGLLISSTRIVGLNRQSHSVVHRLPEGAMAHSRRRRGGVLDAVCQGGSAGLTLSWRKMRMMISTGRIYTI
jgi:hypothetical protein